MTLKAKKKAKSSTTRRSAPAAIKKKTKVSKSKSKTKAKPASRSAASGKAAATAKKKPAAKKTAKKTATTAKAAPAARKTGKKTVKKTAAPARKAATPRKPAAPKPPPRPALSKSEAAARRKQLKKFRVLLLERQRSLMQAYATSKGDTRNNTSDGTEDYIDYAVSSYTREFSLSVTEMERKRLQLVDEALRRLDTRDFGRCLNCGTEVPLPRLEVEPWARYCIRCAELEERGLLEDRDFGADDDDDDDADRSTSSDGESDIEPDDTAGDDDR